MLLRFQNKSLANPAGDQPSLHAVAAFPVSSPSGTEVDAELCPFQTPSTLSGEIWWDLFLLEDALHDTMVDIPKEGERYGDGSYDSDKTSNVTRWLEE